MKYIVYLTTNLKNGKIYVGVHKTKTPYKFDGYIGNGVYISKSYNPTMSDSNTPFKKAIIKYGAKHFIRSLIAIFDKADGAYELEKQIVDKNFIQSKHTYNIKLGGVHASSTNVKSVTQYSTDGVFIKTWSSITEAADSVGIKPATISGVCANAGITAGGYVWRYSTGSTSDVSVRDRQFRGNDGTVNAVKVVQYSKAGYKKRTFESAAKAGTHCNISPSSIIACCKHPDKHRSAAGYQWRYESDKLDELSKLSTLTTAKTIEVLDSDLCLIHEFCSSSKAAFAITGTNARNIRKACKSGKMYKNYYWRFKD